MKQRMSSENVPSADNQQERLLLSVDDLRWYISGFVDGDGCFTVSIHKSKYLKLGWNINPLFQVYQHKDNSKILSVIKDEFGCGNISKKGGNPLCNVYCIDKVHDLINIVIPYFEKYPLQSNKNNDFLIFKKIVIGVSKQLHLNPEGFIELVKLAFKMNRNGKYRKNSLETIVSSIEESPEAKRQRYNV